MGIGDDIMATALAEAVRARNPDSKIVFGDPATVHDPVTGKLNVHFSEAFFHHPDILQPGESCSKFICIDDYPGHRLYIDYGKCEMDGGEIRRFAYHRDFSAPVGSLIFSPDEQRQWRDQARNLSPRTVIVEPHVKGTISGANKAWPWERWVALVARLHNLGFCPAQFIYEGRPALGDVVPLPTKSFRQAAFILDHVGGVVTTDGGLHHAAAALGRSATVLWSSYSHPRNLGYATHQNIRANDEPPTGDLRPSAACAASMAAISVDQVVNAVKEMMT